MNKREQLEYIRQSILGEIYKIRLASGLDPDTFDIESYLLDNERAVIQPPLAKHINKLQIVEKKLEELRDA
jgi:hypothetical protein